ncbi:uncharacterized protein LOC130613993 [Hydractinia symbiolongicarpus]|uniref:uncharacterized protein LOC130613993 n=1 Tax=Hydractinia symbiolongicarpus TaxID=13093 RepID=UPI0025509C8C|nr:uncharacterized protein LOC130613993 [Hydractinia symbiolongicarpus]
MDLFEDLPCKLDDIFGDSEVLDLCSNITYTPSHSSDSGVVDVISVGCNEFLPNFDDFKSDSPLCFAAQVNSLFKRSSISSGSSITSTELDHSYSKTHTISDLYNQEKEKAIEVGLNNEKVSFKANSINVLNVPLQLKRNSSEVLAMNHVNESKFKYVNENGTLVTVDKSRKNAEMAKLNRERKKRYVSNLEAEIKSLRNRNNKLAADKSISENKIKVLENEVKYLRSVLHNRTILSSLVRSISTIPEIQLNIHNKENSEAQAKQPKFVEHLPGKRMPSVEMFNAEYDGGVCLHVSKNKVAIELCAECNQRSK